MQKQNLVSTKHTSRLWVFTVWVPASVEIFEVGTLASLNRSYPTNLVHLCREYTCVIKGAC